MKVAIQCDDAWEREYLETHLTAHEVVFLSPEDVAGDVVFADVQCLCVFIKTPVTKAVLDRFPGLTGIVTRSTGYDHIDVVAARTRNIAVANVPAYGENTIAEYAFALLLALTRQVYDTYERVRESGAWTTQGLGGMDLKGKKMGVVGTGHTGQHVVRIARGFGMDVIAYDVCERKELEGELGFMYVTFEDLLAQSDVLSLHAPYNKHTHHMLHQGNVPQLKQGAILINTARGGLVETKALVRALKDGALHGAGLDVLEEEGGMTDPAALVLGDDVSCESLQVMLANQYLIDHPRVLVMPHNAFNTREARERILATTVANITAMGQGTPLNDVTG